MLLAAVVVLMVGVVLVLVVVASGPEFPAGHWPFASRPLRSMPSTGQESPRRHASRKGEAPFPVAWSSGKFDFCEYTICVCLCVCAPPA